MGELGHDQEVHEVALPIFSEEYKDAAEVIVGEEALTLRPAERGTHTDNVPKETGSRR